MIPVVEIAGARVFLGDCRDVLKTLPDNSVDSIVTDPPYGLGFMGKEWDSFGKKGGISDEVRAKQQEKWGTKFAASAKPAKPSDGEMLAFQLWCTEWATECLRVLKPGGHILAFGGSRTWHRLAVAMEDAGFELRDSIAWIYGSGFPKSLDVSKAIDKKAGAERHAVIEKSADLFGEHENPKIVTRTGKDAGTYGAMTGVSPQTLAATSEAEKWEGWGTALKPAFEPVVVGRKPFGKGVTVAENVLAWGVGGLNIDGSRIAGDPWKASFGTGLAKDKFFTTGDRTEIWKEPHGQGRWPANVILDEVTAGLLDEQSGVSKSPPIGSTTNTKPRHSGSMVGAFRHENPMSNGHGDSGGASRFFYVAKASKRDRNEGLEDLEARRNGKMMRRANNTSDEPSAGFERFDTQPAKNFHPTVKPTQLMRYLIKLVTPPGGTVLDPFTGSGSTGKAALLDGFEFVGAELTEEYLPIIEGRLRWASEQEGETDDTLF